MADLLRKHDLYCPQCQESKKPSQSELSFEVELGTIGPLIEDAHVTVRALCAYCGMELKVGWGRIELKVKEVCGE